MSYRSLKVIQTWDVFLRHTVYVLAMIHLCTNFEVPRARRVPSCSKSGTQAQMPSYGSSSEVEKGTTTFG